MMGVAGKVVEVYLSGHLTNTRCIFISCHAKISCIKHTQGISH